MISIVSSIHLTQGTNLKVNVTHHLLNCSSVNNDLVVRFPCKGTFVLVFESRCEKPLSQLLTIVKADLSGRKISAFSNEFSTNHKLATLCSFYPLVR